MELTTIIPYGWSHGLRAYAVFRSRPSQAGISMIEKLNAAWAERVASLHRVSTVAGRRLICGTDQALSVRPRSTDPLEPFRKEVESLESVVILCAASESTRGAPCGSPSIVPLRIGADCATRAI